MWETLRAAKPEKARERWDSFPVPKTKLVALIEEEYIE